MSIYDEIYRRSEPYWQTRSNEIHLPMAYRYALELLRAHPEADGAIVRPAILMHDNGYINLPPETQLAGLSGSPKGWDPNITRLHEIEGVKIAGEILNALNYSKSRITAIQKIIDGHDSMPTAHSLEDAIVKDADKLWRFTPVAIRITRVWHKRDTAPYIEYLQGSIEKWMLTPRGRELALNEMDASRALFAAGKLETA